MGSTTANAARINFDGVLKRQMLTLETFNIAPTFNFTAMASSKALFDLNGSKLRNSTHLVFGRQAHP